MFGTVLPLIPYSVACYLTDDNVIGNIVVSAELLVFSGVPTKVMGVGTYMASLVEVSDFSTLGWGLTLPRRRGNGCLGL